MQNLKIKNEGGKAGPTMALKVTHQLAHWVTLTQLYRKVLRVTGDGATTR